MADELVERLRATAPSLVPRPATQICDWKDVLRNPNGPEAADRIESLTAQLKEEHESAIVLANKCADLTAQLAEARAEGFKECVEAAAECQPATAEDPNEDDYQRGRFDAVIEYQRAIRTLQPGDGVP